MKSNPTRGLHPEGIRASLHPGYAEIGAAPPVVPGTAAENAEEASEDQPKPLARTRLLIVEDEFLIAQDLSTGLQREGIDVLGPFNTIARAIEVLESTGDIDAAILDLNIRGRVAFDLAEMLADRDIPFIFYTGYDSVIVPEKFRKVGRVRKPAEWPEIRRALFGREAAAATSRERLVKQLSANAPDLASMLPALRLRARQITASGEMAERLVERTLERAITEIGNCPAGVSMEHWLIGLLETTGIGDRKHLN